MCALFSLENLQAVAVNGFMLKIHHMNTTTKTCGSWHTSKHKAHKLHKRYILKMYTCVANKTICMLQSEHKMKH